MTIANKKEPFALLFGDIAAFLLALWVTLFVRYAEVPSDTLFYNHLEPFSVLFLVWVAVFFISGLYDKHTTLLRSKLPKVVLNAQTVNIILAALFFFLAPFVNIAPKTNLVLYSVISSLFILVWRMFIATRIGVRKKQRALIIGHSDEVSELVGEVNTNPRYLLEFVHIIDVDSTDDTQAMHDKILCAIKEGVAVIVIDIKSRKTAGLLPGMFADTEDVTLLDIHAVYEDVFDRVPIGALNESWIFENISTSPRVFYNILKRAMDISGAILIGGVSLLIYPFVIMAIKIEDGGDIFITQRRVGENNEVFSAYKFRSMERNEDGVWIGETSNVVTKVGALIRKTRIDELPQLWNILRGDMSFIGPRPDVQGLNERLSREIPFYNTRSVIKPGLSGWAQIKQDYEKGNQISPQSVVDTQARLMYDVYYVKNRSLLLDVVIALKTIKTVLSKFGS
ncbi:MAG: sugar transferase [Candidatus Pacebacteria bacterium]|nr:sugar transferase [Candidatus Paceibacterota bacterium]